MTATSRTMLPTHNFEQNQCTRCSVVTTARNGLVYAGIPNPIFFLFLNVIPALINMYYMHLSVSVFLTAYLCFAFKKYTSTSKSPFRALVATYNFRQSCYKSTFFIFPPAVPGDRKRVAVFQIWGQTYFVL
jgi:hypothetical protein